MVLTMLAPFLLATRECAMQMLSNATYVLGEMPNVKLSDGLRERTRDVCKALIGTKHDLITELFDLDDLVATEASGSQVGERDEAIVRCASEDESKLDEVATALEKAGPVDGPGSVLASLLVLESAGNVLRGYQPMRTAADAVLRAVQSVRLPGPLS